MMLNFIALKVLSSLLNFLFSKSIFFDGFLPLDKTGVRKARLETSLNQLITFNSTYLDGFKVSRDAYHTASITASQLFDPLRPVPSSLNGIPAPAFLVAAVIEALQDSEYASLTAVVPAEADAFCAGTARKFGGIILTNDSDLPVYDLGEQGAVVFFNQLELLTDDESSQKCQVLRASVSHPLEIAQRLGLEDLKRFSFELLRDPSISLTEIVRRAKVSDPEPLPYEASKQKTFHEFCEEYEPKTFCFEKEVTHKTCLKRNPVQPQLLDPRISELILTSSSSPSIYLPLLIDDPSRAAAWNASDDLRRLAYSCLKSEAEDLSPEIIREYRRQGHRIESNHIQTFSKQKAHSYSQKLATGLETFRSTFGEFSNVTIWRTFALSEILHRYAETQKKPPSKSALAYAIAGQLNRKISWSDIHLSAQMEAVLYSFRMLQQILNYSSSRALSNPPASEPQAEHSSSSSLSPSSSDDPPRLKAILDTLPPLSQLLPSRLELATQPTLDIDRLLALLTSHLQPPPPSPTVATAEDGNSVAYSDPSLHDDGFQTVPKKKRREPNNNKSKETKTPQTRSKKLPDQITNNNNRFNALLQNC